ncbi:MAG: hypothetical protein CVT67_03630 [Actinobacteria bacterium HGW-Actinobacteria-7]|nr:MAG: hypothetical protein CVT67_03630 [Actinobacteria bacterium HGW-Actinobacteria-7]
MSAKSNAPSVPPVIERFVKTLIVVNKAVSLYPPSSSIPRETATASAKLLNEVLEQQPELRIGVAKDGLYYLGIPILHGQPAYRTFALELYNRQLAEVRFHAGTTPRELVGFLSVLRHDPEEVEAAGGFENRLWELGVTTITVVDAHLSIVDSGDVVPEEDLESLRQRYSRAEVDEMLDAAYGGPARDQMTVARFLDDTTAVADYLTQTFDETADGLFDLLGTGARFAQLTEIAFEVGGDASRHELLSSLGAALAALDPHLRRSLLIDEVLPEARTNEPLAALIRQLDIDDVCRMFVEEVGPEDLSRSGLARAIRNLALISMADRDDVVSAAGAAMQGAGFSPQLAGEVLELAVPSKLTVLEGPRTQTQPSRPVDAIFALMDLGPVLGQMSVSGDESDMGALREEARRGVTDGDIIMSMVTLVGLDLRDAQFASTMSVLEDSLELLVERGELDIAADVADALQAATANPEATYEQRRRLERAMGRFTRPSDMRAIAHALRLYSPDSVEYKAARRLIGTMGSIAIDPLLEQLADEPDMGTRKMMVDMLAGMASNYIPEMGGHVSDHRWYVVRNVVSILGATHSSAALPYLERTVRHPDSRVRREAIRALAGIPDRLSVEMLVSALADEDGGNVQLAARYLGSMGREIAVPSLEMVARGEGRGSRDVGPRVEAIEALGKLGAVAALPTLEAIASKRTFMRATKGRELKAAAESAVRRIKASGGGA